MLSPLFVYYTTRKRLFQENCRIFANTNAALEARRLKLLILFSVLLFFELNVDVFLIPGLDYEKKHYRHERNAGHR